MFSLITTERSLSSNQIDLNWTLSTIFHFLRKSEWKKVIQFIWFRERKWVTWLFCHRLFRQNLKRIFFNHRPPDQVTMIQWKEWCWMWSKYFDHLKWRADSLEKTLILRKCWQQKEQWWEKMRNLDSISDSKDSISGRLWEKVKWHS